MDAHSRRLAREALNADPHARARALRDRVRSGDLTWAAIDLAAYLGHPPALLLTGREPHGEPDAAELVRRCRDLACWGPAVQRLALAELAAAGCDPARAVARGLARMSPGEAWERVRGVLLPRVLLTARIAA